MYQLFSFPVILYLDEGEADGKEVRVDMKAQGLVEYALILVFVAIVVVAVLAALGPTLGNTYSEIIGMFP
jgi:pilus assembly protein Flp/PilA